MAEADPAPVPIATIRKNSREEVRVAIATYHGTRFADVRVYAENKAGERVPTPKGVALRLDSLEALIEALEAVRRELQHG